MMEDVIARINELAKKAKAEGLTPAERSERDGLRRIYLDAIRENLTAQLENTYVVDAQGNRHKLQKKGQRDVCSSDQIGRASCRERV